jgi:hypothetical protein
MRWHFTLSVHSKQIINTALKISETIEEPNTQRMNELASHALRVFAIATNEASKV